MKKALIACSLGLIVASCTTQNMAQNTVENPTIYKLKGNWEITSVDYNQKKFKLKPFQEGADAQCFVGSTWNLIPNNNSGSYTLHGGGNCPNVTQPIKFEVTKDKEFRFKKLEQNVKAKNITEGYVLQLENHQNNSFTLVQSVPFEGEIIKVHYQFQRKN